MFYWEKQAKLLSLGKWAGGQLFKKKKKKSDREIQEEGWSLQKPALFLVEKPGLPWLSFSESKPWLSFSESKHLIFLLRMLLKAKQPPPLPPTGAPWWAKAVPYLALAEPCSLNRGSHTDFIPTRHINPSDYTVWMCIIAMLTSSMKTGPDSQQNTAVGSIWRILRWV